MTYTPHTDHNTQTTHTDDLQTTHRPQYTDHTQMTYRPHTDHNTQTTHTYDLQTTYRPHTDDLHTTHR